jgi:hypothetical protein
MDNTSEPTEKGTVSNRRDLLRMGGVAGLSLVGLSGIASADSKKGKDKKKRPPGHTDKKEGKRGNPNPGKGKGRKKRPPGHTDKKKGKRGNPHPGKGKGRKRRGKKKHRGKKKRR